MRNGIVAVILLENLQRASARIAQNDRIRLDMGRNSGEFDVVHTRLEIQWQMLACHEEILVVDGQRWCIVLVICLLLNRCGRDIPGGSAVSLQR